MIEIDFKEKDVILIKQLKIIAESGNPELKLAVKNIIKRLES